MTDISEDDFLDPMPIDFICSITQERMNDPVMAMDGKSYERTGIQQWFDGGNRRSPLSGFTITTTLVPNHDLKARIHQWIDDQLQGRAAKQKLKLRKQNTNTFQNASECGNGSGSITQSHFESGKV